MRVGEKVYLESSKGLERVTYRKPNRCSKKKLHVTALFCIAVCGLNPRIYFVRRLSMIIRVNVVLKRMRYQTSPNNAVSASGPKHTFQSQWAGISNERYCWRSHFFHDCAKVNLKFPTSVCGIILWRSPRWRCMNNTATKTKLWVIMSSW